MPGLLGALVLLMTALDHWTTYLCLRHPVPGFEVSEANPLAAWLFNRMGLLPGLALDSLLTVVAVGFLLLSPRFPRVVKSAVLGLAAAWTTAAVFNNLEAIAVLGLATGGLP